ncbi:MAG: topoisomerase C-terminal repeat-containing protein, partial [Oscillospiraceae bacterium]|nr:topoisomerase C-terminal repeat-containing protein [Oscillospiraceae bacterium]
PLMQKGEIMNGEYFIREGETQPPERYTEATLLSAMELAGQHIEDEEICTLMKMQKKGLGTDATRAPILKGLFNKNYLMLQGKTIFPTDKGIFLIDTLPVENIKSADMTGDWEMKLNQIAMGKADYSQFIREISQVTREWFSAVANAPEQHFSNGTQTDLFCPNCGKPLTRLSTVCKCPECQFHISTYICKVRLSEEIILQLLKKGRSNLVKGFQSKAGEKFNAYLVLNRETGEITFDFTSEQEKNLHCSFCNSLMNPMRYSYQCSNSNCGFKINSEICKKKLTVSQISAILTKGRTTLIKGFKSKAGKSFSAVLYLDKNDRQVKFDFPERNRSE